MVLHGNDFSTIPQNISIKPGMDGSRRWITFEAANLAVFESEIQSRLLMFRQLAQNIPVFIGVEGELKIQVKPYRGTVTMTQVLDLQGIALGPQLTLGVEMWRSLARFQENPGLIGSAVRRSDNQQIAMSQSFQKLFNVERVEDAVRRNRSEYWHLEDLEEFMRLSQQTLEPNNSDSTLEFKARTKSPRSGSWSQYTNRYRLIDDGGILYEVAEVLDKVDVAAPVGLA